MPMIHQPLFTMNYPDFCDDCALCNPECKTVPIVKTEITDIVQHFKETRFKVGEKIRMDSSGIDDSEVDRYGVITFLDRGIASITFEDGVRVIGVDVDYIESAEME